MKKTDVYETTLNSLNDVVKLEDNFKTLKDFKQYIRDGKNVEVLLEDKAIRILGKLEHENIKTNVIQIAIIPLFFKSSYNKDPNDKDLEQIL